MNIAFIPARGGSKSIPLKNIKEIAGKPLIYWTLKAATNCKYIDLVYVATDSEIIKKTVCDFHLAKVKVVSRSDYSASDTATTESAMLEFAERHAFDNIVLVQATSPLLDEKNLNEGFELFLNEEVDSVLSVVRQKRFHWNINEVGFAYSTNYDYNNRPRRQDFDGYLVENGAFYITTRQGLLKSQNRVSGNIKLYEMPYDSYFEVDEQSDWDIIEKLLEKKINDNMIGVKSNIKMLLTDCDGVLTDGGMYYSENGDELKKFNTKDGYAFSILKQYGVISGIITGEKRLLNKRRAEKINVDIFFEGISNKMEIVEELCEKYNISLENVAYIGDDLNDLEVITNVGFGCAVSNAIDKVKRNAKYITIVEGGAGAVREFVEYLIQEGYIR